MGPVPIPGRAAGIGLVFLIVGGLLSIAGFGLRLLADAYSDDPGFEAPSAAPDVSAQASFEYDVVVTSEPGTWTAVVPPADFARWKVENQAAGESTIFCAGTPNAIEYHYVLKGGHGSFTTEWPGMGAYCRTRSGQAVVHVTIWSR